MKNLLKLSILLLISINLYASRVTQEQCNNKGDGFIFAGGECINYFEEEGDKQGVLNIVIHGAWKDGTNTLARYAPFASDLSMNTDITTVAVALPGYSKSSTNNLVSLLHNKPRATRSGKKEYVEFLANLIEALKKKYNAKTINVISHSAGAIMAATITGYRPNLIQNIALAGGRYDLSHFDGKNKLIGISDYINNIPKNTNFLIIYGTKDTISKPDISKFFYKLLKEKGYKATLLEVKGHEHLDLDMSDESVEAFVNMVASE